MKVLVTGGAGYIGSSICWKLNDAGFNPIILDDLSTGHTSRLEDFEHFIGKVGDKNTVQKIFDAHPDLEMVIHCAASIVVPESVTNPIKYLKNNISETINFLDALSEKKIDLVFSSTGSMYGNSKDCFKANEDHEVDPQSPYASTKYMTERMLAFIEGQYDIRYISLRYFNPIGADHLLRTGPIASNPTHLLGSLVKASNSGTTFTITGTDWDTRDGTAIRDYIDINDLADAHVSTLRFLRETKNTDDLRNKDGIKTINLGTGKGTTVLEFVNAFKEVVHNELRVDEGPKRPGDPRGMYCIADNAERFLDWKSETPLEVSIKNSLEWENKIQALYETADS